MGFLGIIDQRVAEILQFHDQMINEDTSLGEVTKQKQISGSRDYTSESPMRRPDNVMKDLAKSVNPPSVREVVNAARNNPSDTEDVFASVPLTRDQLKLKGIDFFQHQEFNFVNKRWCALHRKGSKVNVLQGEA